MRRCAGPQRDAPPGDLQVFSSSPPPPGAQCRLCRLELADPLLQRPLLLLRLELMLGQQLLLPFKHFLLEGEILLPPGKVRLPPGEVRLPPVQGLLFRFKLLLGEGGVAGLALEFLLQLLQPLHSHGLLDPLLFQDPVHGTQLGAELCDDLLPLVQGLLLLGQPLLLPAHLQLSGVHLLEVLFVIPAVLLKLGPLEGEPVGHRLSALLQLGAPVAEALVFGLKRLPLPQDCRLSLMKSLMGTRQHPGEGHRRCFWLGAGPEPPPQNHLRLLRSGQRDEAGHAPRVALGSGGGRSWGLLCRCRRCTRRHRRR
jgi:hypothetical protein